MVKPILTLVPRNPDTKPRNLADVANIAELIDLCQAAAQTLIHRTDHIPVWSACLRKQTHRTVFTEPPTTLEITHWNLAGALISVHQPKPERAGPERIESDEKSIIVEQRLPNHYPGAIANVLRATDWISAGRWEHAWQILASEKQRKIIPPAEAAANLHHAIPPPMCPHYCTKQALSLHLQWLSAASAAIRAMGL